MRPKIPRLNSCVRSRFLQEVSLSRWVMSGFQPGSQLLSAHDVAPLTRRPRMGATEHGGAQKVPAKAAISRRCIGWLRPRSWIAGEGFGHHAVHTNPTPLPRSGIARQRSLPHAPRTLVQTAKAWPCINGVRADESRRRHSTGPRSQCAQSTHIRDRPASPFACWVCPKSSMPRAWARRKSMSWRKGLSDAREDHGALGGLGGRGSAAWLAARIQANTTVTTARMCAWLAPLHKWICAC